MSTTELIKKLRENAGLTQQEVADKLGLARATYAAIEDGREPKLSVIKDLAEFYQIAPGDLVDGKITRAYEPTPVYERIEETTAKRELEPKLNPDKLRDVLLYLTEKIGAKPNVGETVLYKLLYFIDFDYYEKNERSITGLTYIKNHFGPTPAGAFTKILSKMEQDGDMETVDTKYYSHTQKKYLPRKRANLKSLSADELAHIDWEIERLGDKSANELSDFSHLDTPWVVAEPGKPIGYRFVFYRGAKTAVAEPEDEL
jgi:transcriptional regulator with XRE-family HTH domain